MGLLQWITRSRNPDLDPRLAAWRASWNRAAGSADVTALPALREQLDGLGIPDDEIEIEREMLEALEDLSELVASVPLRGLTDDHDRPPRRRRRLLPFDRPRVDARRSIAAGRSAAADEPPGHLRRRRRAHDSLAPGAAKSLHQERDLVLLAKQPDTLVRFRCNGFSDAVRAAFIARALTTTHRRPEAGL